MLSVGTCPEPSANPGTIEVPSPTATMLFIASTLSNSMIGFGAGPAFCSHSVMVRLSAACSVPRISGHFAMKAGLDIETLIATISKGAAQSWQMENRYKTMVAGKFDFGFAVDWMRKDLSICLSEARRNGAHLPLAALIDQFYSQIQKMGGKRWDTSSLIALLNR